MRVHFRTSLDKAMEDGSKSLKKFLTAVPRGGDRDASCLMVDMTTPFLETCQVSETCIIVRAPVLKLATRAETFLRSQTTRDAAISAVYRL